MTIVNRHGHQSESFDGSYSMFGTTPTKAYNPITKLYSHVILPPTSLTCSPEILPTTNCPMSIPATFPNIFSSPSCSQSPHLSLQSSQLKSPDLMLTTTMPPSTKLMKPPQRPPACRACKRRKSKCDFDLPCGTCMLHNTEDSCAYDKLAVPRDRKTLTSRSLSTRTSQLKTLRGRLLDAEKLIAAQKVTIRTQRACLDVRERRAKLNDARSSDRSRLAGDGSGAPEKSSHQSQADDSPALENSLTPATLVEGLTRLVIHSAIAPSNQSKNSVPPPLSSPPSSPPTSTSIAHPTSPTSLEAIEEEKTTPFQVRAAHDASGLRDDVLRLLLKHSGFTYLARHMEIRASHVGSNWLGSLGGLGSCVAQSASRSSHTASTEMGSEPYQVAYPSPPDSLPAFADHPSPLTHHPPTTILPSCITIRTPRDLLVLFPPFFDQALRLLESYLSFVNQVHHLVDGEQARLELKLLYDSYISVGRFPQDSHSINPDGHINPPMPIPELLEIGWLSGTLAIFVLGSNSDEQFDLGDIQYLRRVWLKGALEGLAYRFEDANKNGGRPIDLSTLRCACLVVWIFVLYGKDEDIPPAVNFNSLALYRACDHLQLHRDPLEVFPGIAPRVAEDRRRVFYNMINTDWLFSAIIGKTYSPVSLDGHDVRVPSSLEGRDENSSAIDALGFRSLLMRQLRKLATMWIGSGIICEDQALGFENDLDRLDLDMPDWCIIDVDNFQPAQYAGNPQANLTFSQQIITNVQLCAVRVRFHSRLAVPSIQAPQWVHESAAHHRKICIERAVRLLRLEQLHLTYTTRVLGHSGYPRFHPIVGGLTLSALMAKSRDREERNELFHELTRFTKFIQSCGTLSQVTNLGILAIETALAQVAEEDKLAEEVSLHQSNHQPMPTAIPKDSQKEPPKCGSPNPPENSKASVHHNRFSKEREGGENSIQNDLILFDQDFYPERRAVHHFSPHDSHVHSAQGWTPGMGRTADDHRDAAYCNPRSIDEFLSTWIAGPSAANGIATGETERGQLSGGGRCWGVTQERYYGTERGPDTRSTNPGELADWPGIGVPDMASAAVSMMTTGTMGDRVALRPEDRRPHHLPTNNNHIGVGWSFKHGLGTYHPFVTSASNLISPSSDVTTNPDLSSETAASFNGYGQTQPPSTSNHLNSYSPSMVTTASSSRSFESAGITPPYSAPAGSGFTPIVNPLRAHLSTPSPHSSSSPSTSSRFMSQFALGGRGGNHDDYTTNTNVNNHPITNTTTNTSNISDSSSHHRHHNLNNVTTREVSHDGVFGIFNGPPPPPPPPLPGSSSASASSCSPPSLSSPPPPPTTTAKRTRTPFIHSSSSNHTNTTTTTTPTLTTCTSFSLLNSFDQISSNHHHHHHQQQQHSSSCTTPSPSSNATYFPWKQ